MRRRAVPTLLPLLILLAACGGEEDVEIAGPDLLGLEASQIMVGVEHFMTRDGVRRAHLEADTAYFLDEESRVRFRRYTVDFFGQAGEKVSELTAVDGLYDMSTGDMEAAEDVVVVDTAGYQRLETERLIYEADDDRLRSDRDFVLFRGRDTIRGTGFETDPAMDTLTVSRPATVSPPGSGQPEPEPPPRDSPRERQ